MPTARGTSLVVGVYGSEPRSAMLLRLCMRWATLTFAVSGVEIMRRLA